MKNCVMSILVVGMVFFAFDDPNGRHTQGGGGVSVIGVPQLPDASSIIWPGDPDGRHSQGGGAG